MTIQSLRYDCPVPGSPDRPQPMAVTLRLLAVGPLMWLGVSVAHAQAPDFARDVRPIFAASCLHCHGPEVQESRLRLDSVEAILRGGLSGHAVLPGDSESSLIVRHVTGQATPMMPIDAAPLTATQVALVREWIDDGDLALDADRRRHTLGLRQTHAARGAVRPAGHLERAPDRSVRPGPPRARGARPVLPGAARNADSPAEPRPDWVATHAGRGRRVPRRCERHRRRGGRGCRSPDGLAALRGALGAAVAGSGTGMPTRTATRRTILAASGSTATG